MISLALAHAIASNSPKQAASKPLSILVFSKTAGFRHDSIPTGRAALTNIALEKGWRITLSEDADEFKGHNLRQYDVIVFLSTTGKFLNKSQEDGLVDFIHHGGGYVGIHAAADAEYDWPWYGKLVGAWFKHHPAQQVASVVIEDTSDDATKGLPNPWSRKDEWYDYKASPRPNVHVLASLDTTSYQDSQMGSDHPIMWKHEFEGGRSWYTGMGHVQESYSDPLYLKMITSGIEWAAGLSKRK